jgi:RNA polymerase sigma-70 factor (ECF subfamily)
MREGLGKKERRGSFVSRGNGIVVWFSGVGMTGFQDPGSSTFAIGFLRHEAEVRRWLRARMSSPDDVEDVIQEAYCRAWAARGGAKIENPRAYFFQVVRSIVIDQLRRSRVVKIEAVADLEAFGEHSEEPGPERIAAGHGDLARVRAFLAGLPDRCRKILVMRKIEGVPQKEIARQLGVSESIVENEAAKGLRLLLDAFAERDSNSSVAETKLPRRTGRERTRL